MISSYVVQCMYISFLIPFYHRYRPKPNNKNPNNLPLLCPYWSHRIHKSGTKHLSSPFKYQTTQRRAIYAPEPKEQICNPRCIDCSANDYKIRYQQMLNTLGERRLVTKHRVASRLYMRNEWSQRTKMFMSKASCG